MGGAREKRERGSGGPVAVPKLRVLLPRACPELLALLELVAVARCLRGVLSPDLVTE